MRRQPTPELCRRRGSGEGRQGQRAPLGDEGAGHRAGGRLQGAEGRARAVVGGGAGPNAGKVVIKTNLSWQGLH